MRSIGGFFSLELPHNTGGELYPKAIRLNSGRSCFEYILKARGYKKVWLPYYTCDVRMVLTMSSIILIKIFISPVMYMWPRMKCSSIQTILV